MFVILLVQFLGGPLCPTLCYANSLSVCNVCLHAMAQGLW